MHLPDFRPDGILGLTASLVAGAGIEPASQVPRRLACYRFTTPRVGGLSPPCFLSCNVMKKVSHRCGGGQPGVRTRISPLLKDALTICASWPVPVFPDCQCSTQKTLNYNDGRLPTVAEEGSVGLPWEPTDRLFVGWILHPGLLLLPDFQILTAAVCAHGDKCAYEREHCPSEAVENSEYVESDFEAADEGHCKSDKYLSWCHDIRVMIT